MAIYYIDEVSSARWRSYDWYDYGPTYYGPSPEELTRQGGLVMLLFTLYMVFTNLSNMIKVKTMTSKVLSIIGISFNGIVFIVNLLMIVVARDMHFDESTGPMWALFAPIMLAFSIVYLVQASKKAPSQLSEETLDDILTDEIV